MSPGTEGFRGEFHRLWRGASAVVRNADAVAPALRRLDLVRAGESLLSIGGGGGRLEVELTRELDLQLGFIEPQEGSFQAFEERVREAGVGHRVVVRHPGPFQTFSDPRTWDVVLAVHSWYRLSEDPAQLERALRLRAAGGRLIIVLISSSSLQHALVRALENDHPSARLTAESFSRWATDRGYDHRRFECRIAVPATECLTESGLTAPARDLVAFLAYRRWREVPERLRLAARRVLEDAVVDGRVEFQAQGLVFSGAG